MRLSTWDSRLKRPSTGGHVVEWIEANCVHGEGDHYGQAVTLEPWQQRLLWEMYEVMPDGTRAFGEILVGLPKGNGKSQLASWIALHELACEQCAPVSPVVVVSAASYEQADLLLSGMRASAIESPTLRRRLEPFDTEILLRGAPGRAYRVAAVRGTNDGARPTAFVADELHEWTTMAHEGAFLVLGNGTTKRRNSVRIYITTAGSNPESLLGKLFAKGERIAAQIAAGEPVEDPRYLMVWWQGPEDVDLSDPAAVRAAVREASPAADSFLDVEAVATRATIIPKFEWMRYFLNRWTESDESWLPVGAWEACAGDLALSPTLPTYVGVDVSLKWDCTAVVTVQPRPDGRIAVSARIWDPQGTPVDVAAIENHLRELRLTHQDHLKAIAYDPFGFQKSAQALEDEGLPMIEVPQSAERMVPAAALAYELIASGTVLHDANPVLTAHVLAAEYRESERGPRLSKGRSKRPIDGAIAMLLALSLAHTPEARPVQAPFAVWA